jgi:hypothetical protein
MPHSPTLEDWGPNTTRAESHEEHKIKGREGKGAAYTITRALNPKSAELDGQSARNPPHNQAAKSAECALEPQHTRHDAQPQLTPPKHDQR